MLVNPQCFVRRLDEHDPLRIYMRIEEEKSSLMEEKRISPATLPAKLTSHYLGIFKDKELEAIKDENDQSFIKDLQKTKEELAETVAKYQVRYWFYRVENWLANATNLLFILFQVNTGKQGIESCIKVFTDEKSPDLLNTILGYFGAIMSTGLYILLLSAQKEAIKSTLKYAYRKSLIDKISDSCKEMFNYADTNLKGFIVLANMIVLVPTYLTAAMQNVIDIYDPINTLPTSVKWLSIITIVYFSTKYLQKYLDENYYNGLKFWRDNKLPWLITEIRHGHIAIPLQIMMQASSLGIRSIVYYYIAEASKRALGFWFPTELIVAISVFHGFCILYPETYKHYMNHKNQITESVKNINEFNNKYIEAYKTYGQAYLFKTDPMAIILIALRTATSGWFGWEMGTYARDDNTLTLPILFAIVMAFLFGASLFRAESNTIIFKKIVDDHFTPDKSLGENKQTRGILLFATMLNFINSLTLLLSTVGSSKRLLGLLDISPRFIPALIAIAIERSANLFWLNKEKVEKTTLSVLGMFAPKKPAAKAATQVIIADVEMPQRPASPRPG